LPDIRLTSLRERATRQAATRAAADAAWLDTEFVVVTRHGTPIEPQNFHRDLNGRCRNAGVREVPVHNTWRTCASLLAALDVHPRVAMPILRHTQIAVTMDVYTEISSHQTRAPRSSSRSSRTPRSSRPATGTSRR
jgi:integrase